jgi:hypothetical protein
MPTEERGGCAFDDPTDRSLWKMVAEGAQDGNTKYSVTDGAEADDQYLWGRISHDGVDKK